MYWRNYVHTSGGILQVAAYPAENAEFLQSPNSAVWENARQLPTGTYSDGQLALVTKDLYDTKTLKTYS